MVYFKRKATKLSTKLHKIFNPKSIQLKDDSQVLVIKSRQHYQINLKKKPINQTQNRWNNTLRNPGNGQIFSNFKMK
jgi:hypothetical protein